MAVTTRLLPISPVDYSPHTLHDHGRVWPAKNCYVDVWIELLHSVGLEPLAAGAFCLAADFEGDQWSFFKFPPEDLRRLFGVEVAELSIWRPVMQHVLAQQQVGRLTTVEVDSFFLPDTAGLSYRTQHVKTTIVPHVIDPDRRHLEYFHGEGYFELADDDFDGLFSLGPQHRAPAMSPYVEVLKFDGMRRVDALPLAVLADELLGEHLGRRPPDNPVERMGACITADLRWLASGGSSEFHAYAFAMCRQFGACAEMAAAFTGWLAESGRPAPPALETAAAHLSSCSQSAKSLQFTLARAARGRAVDVAPLLADMARHWACAIDVLAERSGR